MRLNSKRQATSSLRPQPQQQRRQLQLLSNSVFGVSNTINSRSTRLTNKKMFKSSVVGMQQQQQHHSQQLMRGGGNGTKTRPKYQQQQQQQFQPQMRQFYAVTSPIKINSQFNQRGGGNSGQFNQFNYHRQTSQPQSLMSTRPRMAHHNYQHSYNNQVIDNNFRPMNSNSFLSFSNNAPQQQQHQQQFQHQHNYQTRFKHRQTAGKATKLLSAPYNTTQYIMYDYSKRKTSSGEDAQKEQFEHDWDMQMQQTDDDVNEQFVCEPIRRSSEQPLDGTLSHSESNLDQTDSSNGQPQQPVVISQNDHEDVNMINRLSTSI